MNSLIECLEIYPDELEKGDWLVRFNQFIWRFKREHFAQLFAFKIRADENFFLTQMEHYRNHNWDECQMPPCEGYLWQLIQGMK